MNTHNLDMAQNLSPHIVHSTLVSIGQQSDRTYRLPCTDIPDRRALDAMHMCLPCDLSDTSTTNVGVILTVLLVSIKGQ